MQSLFILSFFLIRFAVLAVGLCPYDRRDSATTKNVRRGIEPSDALIRTSPVLSPRGLNLLSPDPGRSLASDPCPRGKAPDSRLTRRDLSEHRDHRRELQRRGEDQKEKKEQKEIRLPQESTSRYNNDVYEQDPEISQANTFPTTNNQQFSQGSFHPQQFQNALGMQHQPMFHQALDHNGRPIQVQYYGGSMDTAYNPNLAYQQSQAQYQGTSGGPTQSQMDVASKADTENIAVDHNAMRKNHRLNQKKKKK